MEYIAWFTERCREHKLKVTPQRIAVYRHLQGNRQHPSTEQIFREVQREFPTMSLDTVNRTLLTFADIGIVDIVEGYGGPRRFDPDCSPHHHFHCLRCGRITDFRNRDFDRLEVPEKIARRCVVTGKRVSLTGICPECR
jgi:Fur family peroxide stress response transcriptional regulator